MTAQETYYTPERVERLLRQLPYLLDRQAPPDDSPRIRAQHTSPGGWLEEQMAKRADLMDAIVRLPQPTRTVICRIYLWEMTLREVGAEIGCSHVTILHHKREGLKRLAWELGWRDPENGWT